MKRGSTLSKSENSCCISHFTYHLLAICGPTSILQKMEGFLSFRQFWFLNNKSEFHLNRISIISWTYLNTAQVDKKGHNLKYKLKTSNTLYCKLVWSMTTATMQIIIMNPPTAFQHHDHSQRQQQHHTPLRVLQKLQAQECSTASCLCQMC